MLVDLTRKNEDVVDGYLRKKKNKTTWVCLKIIERKSNLIVDNHVFPIKTTQLRFCGYLYIYVYIYIYCIYPIVGQTQIKGWHNQIGKNWRMDTN